MSAIFPIAYFGSIAYYQNMVQAGEISFELHEHYVKQTLRNRTSILGPNGLQALSIPVIKPDGNKSLTENILISNAENWQKTHWKAIETAYASSPYFDHYGMEVKELIYFENINLVEYNLNIHHRIKQWLDLQIATAFTSEYQFSNSQITDFRNTEFEETKASQYVRVFPEIKVINQSLSILDAIFNLGPMARKIIV